MPLWLADLFAVLQQSAVMLWRLAPYVIAGAALGAALVCRRDAWLPRTLAQHRPGTLIVGGCLLGTVSPLCTMGTLPILAGLLRRGMPAAAAVAFLGGSSMTNPQLFVLTTGTLGLPLALGQWGASLGVGLTLGLLALRLERVGWRVQTPAAPDMAPAAPRAPGGRVRTYLEEFVAQLDYVVLYLVAGVLAAAAINVYLPQNALESLVGTHRSLAVVLGAILSGPFYVCGGGALPAMAALMAKGLPAGAALAFFVAGPATRIQALAALGAVVRPWFLALYVAVVLAWALLAGFAANVLLPRAAG